MNATDSKIDLRWHQYWSNTFFRISDPEDILVWEAELNRMAPGLTEPEIIAGIHDMADHTGLWPDFPKVRHLAAAIRGLRDRRRIERETADQCEDCDGCGWVSVDVEHDGSTYPIGVPCICERGKRVLAKTYPPEQHAKMRDYAKLAANQAKERKA